MSRRISEGSPAADAGPSPSAAWTVAEAQEFDRHLQEHCRVPAGLLMENAGRALALEALAAARQFSCGRLLFLVGPGNNGGDALVAARQVHLTEGIDLELWAPLGTPFQAGSPAATAYEAACGVGLRAPSTLPDARLGRRPLVVDGLFGVGLSRPLEGGAAAAVERVRVSGAPVLAVDLPSGLDGDSGEILGTALPAWRTLTFVGPKQGCLRGEGPALSGELCTAGIGVSDEFAAAWLARRRGGTAPG